MGSPIEEDSQALIRLGKKLKKNNVALDIINFGEFEENVSKLEAFLESVQNGDTWYLARSLEEFLSNIHFAVI